MGAIAAIVVFGALAYLGAGRIFRVRDLRAGPRYLLVSGVEFVVVGLLLGPEVLGAVKHTAAQSLAPFFHVVVGWVGFSVGLEIPLGSLRRIDPRAFALSGLESACTIAVVGSACWLFARAQPDLAELALSAALILGATAAVTAPTGFGVVERELRPRGKATELIRLLTTFSTLGSVGAFCVVACYARSLEPGPFGALEWLLVAVMLGAALGAIAHLATVAAKSPAALLLSLLGCTLFAGGVLTALRISPLAPCLVAGMVLSSMARDARALRDATARVERPLYLGLLLFAGLCWRPGTLETVLVAAVFLAARILGKLFGGSAASRLAGHWHPEGLGAVRQLGLALLPHGGLAVSMALSYSLLRGGAEGDLVLSAVLTSVIASSLASPYLVQKVLRQSGEIP